MVLDRVLQRSRVRADHLTNLLAVLEQHERWHGAHGELLRNFGDFVDVELVEARVRVCVGEPESDVLAAESRYKDCATRRAGGYLLDDLGSNDLARSAPSGKAVEDHQSALLAHGLVKVGLGLEVVDAFLAHCCGC